MQCTGLVRVIVPERIDIGSGYFSPFDDYTNLRQVILVEDDAETDGYGFDEMEGYDINEFEGYHDLEE